MSFFSRPVGLGKGGSSSGLTMRMAPGRAVYDAFLGRPGRVTESSPFDLEETIVPCKSSSDDASECCESSESLRMRPGVGASRCRLWKYDEGVEVVGRRDGDISRSLPYLDVQRIGVAGDSGLGGLKEDFRMARMLTLRGVVDGETSRWCSL